MKWLLALVICLVACSEAPPKKSGGRFLATVDPAVALIYDNIVMDMAHNRLGNCLMVFRDFQNPQDLIDKKLIIPGKPEESFLYLATHYHYSKNQKTKERLARVIASLEQDTINNLLEPADPNKVQNTHLIHILRYCNQFPARPVDIHNLHDWIKEKKY